MPSEHDTSIALEKIREKEFVGSAEQFFKTLAENSKTSLEQKVGIIKSKIKRMAASSKSKDRKRIRKYFARVKILRKKTSKARRRLHRVLKISSMVRTSLSEISSEVRQGKKALIIMKSKISKLINVTTVNLRLKNAQNASNLKNGMKAVEMLRKKLENSHVKVNDNAKKLKLEQKRCEAAKRYAESNIKQPLGNYDAGNLENRVHKANAEKIRLSIRSLELKEKNAVSQQKFVTLKGKRQMETVEQSTIDETKARIQDLEQKSASLHQQIGQDVQQIAEQKEITQGQQAKFKKVEKEKFELEHQKHLLTNNFKFTEISRDLLHSSLDHIHQKAEETESDLAQLKNDIEKLNLDREELKSSYVDPNELNDPLMTSTPMSTLPSNDDADPMAITRTPGGNSRGQKRKEAEETTASANKRRKRS